MNDEQDDKPLTETGLNGSKQEIPVGTLLPSGFIYCGCPARVEIWVLTDGPSGFTIFQCSACKRNVGTAYAKQKQPLIVPGRKM